MTGDASVIDSLLVQFGRLHERFDRLDQDMLDLKRRVTSLETQAALIHGDFAAQSARIDRIEARLERIEHRLDLAEAP